MTARVDTSALDRVIGQLVRARGSSGVQRDLVEMLHGEALPLRARIQGAATSPVERRAASSVAVSRTADGVKAEGGRGGGPGAVLFPGGEFGGRKSRRVMVRSGTGRVGATGWRRRRTTMQFKPHLGTEGYFFWPTVREWLPEVRRKAEETVEESIT